MLDFVRIDGVTLSVGQGALVFNNYFDVDSISLLLGKNGSGKTALMLKVAEVLTSGASMGDQGHWLWTNSDGDRLVSDARYPLKELGVIYYTSQPISRKIQKNDRYIDASAISDRDIRHRMFHYCSEISEIFGFDPKMIAKVVYKKDIFDRLIFPVIVDGRCSLGGLNWSGGYDFGLFDDDRQNELKSRIKKLIYSEIRDELYLDVCLACLEHQSRDLKDRFFAVRAFLVVLGLGASSLVADVDKKKQAENRFITLVRQTKLLLDSVGRFKSLIDDEYSGFQFDVNNARQLRDITSYKGAVEVHWINLSSGMLSLVSQFSRLDHALERLKRRKLTCALILIDEGDAFLHLDWQRRYVNYVNKFFAARKIKYKFNLIQVVIATHSPIISGDFPSAMVQRLDAGIESTAKTFAGGMDYLVLEAFDTPSIGEYAAEKIIALRKNFLSNELSKEDLLLINEIADECLKNAVCNSNGAAS